MADEGNEWGDKILSDNGIFTTLIVVFFLKKFDLKNFIIIVEYFIRTQLYKILFM